MTSSIIAACAAVAVALIEAFATVQRARSTRRQEQQQKLMLAQYEVSAAQSEAIRLLLLHAHGEHLNGNVDAAIKRLDEAERNQARIKNEIISAA